MTHSYNLIYMDMHSQATYWRNASQFFYYDDLDIFNSIMFCFFK